MSDQQYPHPPSELRHRLTPLTLRLQEIDRAIGAKISAIRDAVAIRDWRFRIAPRDGLPGAEIPAYDDGNWQTVRLMRTWSSADGDAWFRLNVDVPPVVEGIALIGTSLDLEVVLTIGATIFVNGQQMFQEPSWSDSRAVPLPLTQNYQPGAPMTVAVRCNAGDGFGLFLSAGLRFGRLAGHIFDLDLVRAQMTFTRFLAEDGPLAAADKVAAWVRAADALDLAALVRNDWDAWRLSVARAREALAPLAGEAKTYTAHLIAHSHIDMNWLWPWKETVDICRRDFASVDKLMAAYPEFHFSQSQASTYAAIEDQHPALFERVRQRIKEGRWDVTATNWVEGDLNTACGESLVRQILHTRRYISDRFGLEPLVCWEPDTFGHVATYPQILRKSGIRYYYFCRAGKGHPLFWWEGLDGSRVLAVQDLRGYGGTNDPSELVGSVLDFAARYGIHDGENVYGVGDHGGGATARDIEMARVIDHSPFMPRALPGSSAAFYEHVLAEIGGEDRPGAGPRSAPVAQSAVPVVRGELNTVFEGCYTSHGDIKRLNRDGENGLLTAEALAALSHVMAGSPYPLADLGEAWRTVCFHQFHDILCGCAIGVTYREAHERMSEAANAARSAAARSMDGLAAALDTGAAPGGDSRRIVVFNPLAWTRTDVARVPLAALGGWLPKALTDDAGRPVPVQVVGDQLLFIAEGLPSMGARVYRPADVTPDAGAGVWADSAAKVLDNGVLRLRVHPSSGAIDQLVDVENNRDIAGPWAGWGPEAKINAGMLNRLQVLWEQPHPMSAWNIGDITRVDHLIAGAQVRLVEQGPVMAALEVRRAFLSSSLLQRIVLYRGLRRIDFETEVDWRERGSAHQDAPMLRATFSPFLDQAKATFEIAFAGLERPADGREVPALRWMDVSEPAYGMSLLNDCKYGHQAHGNTLGLTLVRASYEPDNHPDEGLHRLTYALYPHAGTWKEAGTTQRAAELNQPLQVVVTGAHDGSYKPGEAWLCCDSDHVLVSAVKLAEDQPEHGTAVVVRLYEAHGIPASARLAVAWPVARADETDLLERPVTELTINDGALEMTLAPHEIKTLRLTSA